MAKLAKAIARKVEREEAQHVRSLDFVADDAFTIIRQALATYHLPFYVRSLTNPRMTKAKLLYRCAKRRTRAAGQGWSQDFAGWVRVAKA